MGKRFRNIITTFIAVLSLIILAFSFKTNNVKAANNFTSSDMITSGAIVNQDKTYSMSSNVPLEYHFDTTGHDVSNGDTLTIDVPSPLTVTPGSNFDVTDDSGKVIGTAVLGNNNQIVVTFNDIEDHASFQGKLNIDTGINIDRKAAEVGTNTVPFPIKDGQFQDSTLKTSVSNKNVSKSGKFGTDENGEDIVTWTVLANRNELNFGTLNISDTINDPNLEYIQGSLTVQEAAWKDADTGTYSRGRTLASSEYTLNETSDSFNVSIPKAGTQMYAVTFQTKVTDPNKVTDGTVMKNSATMNGTIAGNGNNSTTIEENASGKVSGGTNSGSGSGDKLGGVTLTKLDEQNNNASLSDRKSVV